MSASDPRIEFRPGPELRRELEELRLELSKHAGRTISMSDLIRAIVREYFSRTETKKR